MPKRRAKTTDRSPEDVAPTPPVPQAPDDAKARSAMLEKGKARQRVQDERRQAAQRLWEGVVGGPGTAEKPVRRPDLAAALTFGENAGRLVRLCQLLQWRFSDESRPTELVGTWAEVFEDEWTQTVRAWESFPLRYRTPTPRTATEAAPLYESVAEVLAKVTHGQVLMPQFVATAPHRTKGTVGWYRVFPVLLPVRCEPAIDGTGAEPSVPGYAPCERSSGPWPDFCAALTALYNAERLLGFDRLEPPLSLSKANSLIPNMVEVGDLDSPVRVVPFPQNGPDAWFPRFPCGEEGSGSCFSDDFLREAIQEVQDHTDLKLASGENPWLYLSHFQGYCGLVADEVREAILQGKNDDECLDVASFGNWRRAEAQEHLIVPTSDSVLARGEALKGTEAKGSGPALKATPEIDDATPVSLKQAAGLLRLDAKGARNLKQRLTRHRRAHYEEQRVSRAKKRKGSHGVMVTVTYGLAKELAEGLPRT